MCAIQPSPAPPRSTGSSNPIAHQAAPNTEPSHHTQHNPQTSPTHNQDAPHKPARPLLGISRCLLGDKVRYDGGHKRDRYLTEVLGPFVDFAPICPEVECGLPIPREAMRLVGDASSPRLVGQKSGADHTERMLAWAQAKLDEIRDLGPNHTDLCGFVFKKDSPSSGMERVKVYPDTFQGEKQGPGVRNGRGLFAGLFQDRFPNLPVEDEGRLNDAGLRENFLERVFTMHRWLEHLKDGKGLSGLMDFHTRHKLLLMAHNVEAYRRLGRLVAQAKGRDLDQVRGEYLAELMAGLKRKATPKQHRNVLEHCLGYFKRQLSTDEKAELLEVIAAYAHGLTPLIAPMTLMNHYVRKYRQPYLAAQVYLNPHPLELMLRNHV